MQLKTKAGLAMVALGFAVFGAWRCWLKTRNFMPVDVPVSLVTGQSVDFRFKLNFDGLYVIQLEAEKTLPLDTLDCLMGVDVDESLCKDTPSAIAATWTLSSNGHEIRRGDSREPHSAHSATVGVARVIGEFQGRSSHTYRLQVALASDGGNLVAAHPRLKVAAASIAYTDLQSAGVLVFSMMFICELCGLILLGVAYYGNRRKDRV